MRRAIKDPNSTVLTESLRYISNNSTNNKRIADILLNEQEQFCAYTDEHISRTDAKDIDHFNPRLKDTPDDNYYNWFVVKHQWNMEKSERWHDFQPVLHPQAEDLEERIKYNRGDYIAESSDEEAINLIKLLKLDDIMLAEKRKKYIQRKRDEIAAFNQPPEIFFSILIDNDECQVSYPRAIKEEFGVDIWKAIQLD